MKAKIRRCLGHEDGMVVWAKEPDLIEFELDETYWRNEFAKAALNRADTLIKLYKEQNVEVPSTFPEFCFNIADAMIAESKKRNKQ